MTKQSDYLHYVRVIKTILFKNTGPFFLAALTKNSIFLLRIFVTYNQKENFHRRMEAFLGSLRGGPSYKHFGARVSSLPAYKLTHALLVS